MLCGCVWLCVVCVFGKKMKRTTYVKPKTMVFVAVGQIFG